MVMSRKPFKRNFVINLLAPLARIAVALVTIPIYVRHVGDARYGVISIMWVLLGYFGFLDLGLSRAPPPTRGQGQPQIGRASCRERVCNGV